MVRMTMLDTIEVAAQRQGWSKIARRITVEKFVNHIDHYVYILHWRMLSSKHFWRN